MSDPELDAARARGLLETHAPALLGLVRSDETALGDVLRRPLGLGSDEATYRAGLGDALGPEPVDSPDVRRALRRFRHREIIRIALREILSLADIERTSAEMALLAATVIDAALGASLRTQRERDGPALDADGRAVPLTVLGMGKLGGLELNLGSDVDLIFFYGTDDGAAGERTIHDHFARAVQRAVKTLSEVTEHGFCFRVDLRLRPEGSRGPLVNSLASAERYYQTWGRTWERSALLRARPIAGDRAFGEEVLEALGPFIYRRAVDPSLAESMQEMLLRSRRELKVDEARDLKLGRGGIREAEFFVQTLQLVWGGQHPELRVPGTLEALARLRATGLVTDREAEDLERAWALLRRVEHRIHAYRGWQTHALPADPGELDALARSLGYADGAALEDALTARRGDVAALFATLLPGAPEAPDAAGREDDDLLDAVARGDDAEAIAARLEGRLDVSDPFAAAAHLARLARRAVAPLSAVYQERAPALGRALLSEVRGAADPDAALRFLADFFERLGGRWPYERLLLERPRLLRRLVGLFGASGTLSQALVGHPEDLDQLLSSEAPSVASIDRLHARLEAELGDDPDPEVTVRELRRLGRTFELQLGLAFAGAEIDLPETTDRLSALAEAQIRVSVEAATRWSRGRHGAASGELVVVAMGKLGGRELGFAGDLDLVFLYERDGQTSPTPRGASCTHAEAFTRIAQRTMQLLRQRDAEGAGYDTDTRLRPSGSRGTLVVSFEAFDRYHERGAQAWERQALIRARPVTGSEAARAEVTRRFEALAYGRGPTPPAELAHTRARMQSELAGESRDRYHPKLGYGGLVDVELLVQWLQMRHGASPSGATVRTPSTARALDALEASGALASDEAAALREAYTFLRRVEQSLKLHDPRKEHLETLGRTGAHVARSLGVRARDGLAPTAALDFAYRRHASASRALFEQHVGPVDAGAPWSRA